MNKSVDTNFKQQQQLDTDNDCFYDSFDRIISSTNSSCSSSHSHSNSDNDDDELALNSRHVTNNCLSPDYDIPTSTTTTLPIPNFPMGVSNNYDIWISQPSSVEERRMRLLRSMGLSHHPSLSRQKSSINTYSNSDSSVSVGVCKFTKSISADYSSVSINSISSSVVNKPDLNQPMKVDISLNAVLPNKPPTGKVSKRNEEIDKIDSTILSSNNGAAEVKTDGLDCDGVATDSDQVCIIKNLDNGKEFVVNHVPEDGTLDKVKEVSTGRHLTMEEFEMCVGHSPIVQELMRRQNVESRNKGTIDLNVNGSSVSGSKVKKKGGWLRNIKNVANSVTGRKERKSSDDKDTSSEKGGRRSSSVSDESQDVSFHCPERVKVRQYGKSCKDLTALYKSQEIQAHTGSIWAIKFSLDGKFLASAGEDCVIHVWQVGSTERKGDLLFDKPEDGNLNILWLANGSPELNLLSPKSDGLPEKKRRGRLSISRKSVCLDNIVMPESIFALSEKPLCSFQGHLDDVLDLSWSKSQHLLSSSMDKTVRLWQLSSKSCLKIFSHSDYVTCIQFNPVDDRYFISGSLDAKVRIWSIPDRQVVDWSDLNEMVTAACYTPDGQGALVGSYKGSCRLYNTAENKLQQKSQINLQNKKKKAHHKKITGFQFAPGSSSEVLITSADSRVRVVDGVDFVHKFKGFRNTNSQISASLTANGRYVISASEDSHVYIWKHEGDSRPSSRNKGVTVTQGYEHFHCQDVSVAIPWPGMSDNSTASWGFQDNFSGEMNRVSLSPLDEVSTAYHPPTPEELNRERNGDVNSPLAFGFTSSPLHGVISNATDSYFFDRISATWPEEKLLLATKHRRSSSKHRSSRTSVDLSFNGLNSSKSAWGMVIVTAGLRGEIRTFQNFGLPVRI